MTWTRVFVLVLAAEALCGCAAQRWEAPGTEIDEAIAVYRGEVDGGARAAALEQLAVTGDPRAAVVLGEALDDPDVRVRVAATNGMVRHFMPQLVAGGTEQQMLAAREFWSEQGQRYRERAAAASPRRHRQAAAREGGDSSASAHSERLVPVVVELSAPGTPYRVGSPIMLVVTIKNESGREIVFQGFGIEPTEWNAETANIALTDIEKAERPLNLYLERPRTNPPHEISGQGGVRIAAGADLSVSFDARKWRIVGDWEPGAYRLQAAVHNVQLDAYTSATIGTDECLIRIE